jgi:hypothetical protein
VNGPSSELGPFVASPTKVEQQKCIATTNKHLPIGVKYNDYQRFVNAGDYASNSSSAVLAIEVGVN